MTAWAVFESIVVVDFICFLCTSLHDELSNMWTSCLPVGQPSSSKQFGKLNRSLLLSPSINHRSTSMAGSSNPSQELLSLLLGGGGGGPAIPNGGPPPIQPKPASNSTAAALPAATPGQDPLEALFQAMKVKEQAPSPLSPHQQSQPPMPAPRPDARQASFLAAFNSPHMPTKPILNGSPSKGSEPALEVSDGGRQLLAMLNAMGGGGSRETSSKAPAPQSEEQVLPPVTMPESEGSVIDASCVAYL